MRVVRLFLLPPEYFPVLMASILSFYCARKYIYPSTHLQSLIRKYIENKNIRAISGIIVVHFLFDNIFLLAANFTNKKEVEVSNREEPLRRK